MIRGTNYGFTIVELIVVIAIIGILAAVGIVSYTGVQRDARDKALLSDVDSLEGILASHMVQNGGGPTAYYSEDTGASAITFTPSQGNILDVTTAGVNYCIRAWNPAANRASVETAFTKGSTPEACLLTDPSIAAGGTGGKVVGWWKLNGGAVDSSGEGHNGVIDGATSTTGEDGSLNGAYSFSTTTVNSIDTGYNFPLDTLSVSMWIKWAGDSRNSYGSLISNSRDWTSGTEYNGFQMHLAKSNSRIGSRLWYGASYSGMTTPEIPIGQWTHVALTYDGQTSALYMDGQQVQSKNLSQSLGSSAYNVFIGRGGWSNNYSFGGDIDDVRIYNYGLSSETVESIYTMGAL